jgi:class 3 adenylate cyclase/tetratricopeptide (TPR) repeat protein
VEGERKQVTVLLCCVADASVLAERLGPAYFDSLMTELVGMVAEETGRYEGVLRRTRPDGFEAMFGARVLHEDDPWRAVLTALAVQRGVAQLLPQPTSGDERLAIRIGIATGPVVVTRRVHDRDVDYSAVGETMRVADLLQQLAEPGTILISHATCQAVAGYVALERMTLEVGGAAAFRITGAAPARLVRPPRLMRTLEPFVGRVHELGLLANLATRARAGRGQVAGVVGEPGIGKSRLLLEFTSAMPDVTVVESRCVSYGSLVPYLPLADLVRAYCGVKDGESVDEACRAVRAAIAPAALPGDAEKWLLRPLGAGDTAADNVSPEAVKARTFDVLRALLFHASTLRPVVIVIEDIHWIDRTSEEFLALVVERVVAARILIIVTFRPGYQPPWRDRSQVTQLMLAALTAADSETLIGAIARETRLPPQASAEILAKAEGNPFFLEELTRAVLEHGPNYVAMNHLLAGSFEAALAEAARADAVGREIGDLRLQTYAGFTTGWVEASRGNHATALAMCRRSLDQAPDRVSRAYASMVLGYALLEAGDYSGARERLEPIVAELESFGFLQWHAWTSILAGEAYRLDGALDIAEALVTRGLEVATQAPYWYAVGFAERIAGRIARDRGNREESVAALDRALDTFERIGARFEEARTRQEAVRIGE